MKSMTTLIALLISFNAHAQQHELNANDAKAVQETQAMLANPAAIQAYAKDHPEAAAANNQVQSLTGGNAADSAAVYKLANEIFSNMAKESGGDAAGMQKTLQDAMKNPQSFADKLSPDEKAQLKELANKIDSRAPTSAPH